jgi:hypothetical protein
MQQRFRRELNGVDVRRDGVPCSERMLGKYVCSLWLNIPDTILEEAELAREAAMQQLRAKQ